MKEIDGNVRPTASPTAPFRTLWRFNRPYASLYLIGAGLALLFALINLALPLIVRAMIGNIVSGDLSTILLVAYFSMMLGAAVASGIARYFQRTRMIGASRRFEYDLRNAYFNRILSLPARFFNRMSTGDIMARATSDVNHVRDFIGPGIMGTVDMTLLPFTLGMMVYLSPRLTGFALLPLPVLTLMVYLIVRLMNHQSQIVQHLFSTISARAQENLAGARVVRAYAIEDRESHAFREASEAYKRANIILATIMSCAWPLIDLLVGITILVIILQGGRMVIRGDLSLADFTAFMIVTAMLAWPLVQFGWVLTLYQRGAVSMNRISEILAAPSEIRDEKDCCAEARIDGGHILFEGVSFRYDLTAGGPDAPEWTVQDLSFEVRPGETLAIVGPTGSGKSTVISLLCRLYDPERGRICVEGRDIREYPINHLRHAIGCAPQDSFVFSDTIRENILLGKADIGEAVLKRACDTAQFTADLEEMPMGINTLLGERGINLSGGQKQRLSLARALARDPIILLLDDSLSSVDADTEQAILRGLHTVMADRTSIVISHRVAAVMYADHIIVLENGRIVEQGVHKTLLAGDGVYARMYRRQLLEAQLERNP